jgi:hypothetical protein
MAPRRAAIGFATLAQNIVRKGGQQGMLRDLYAALLRASWLVVLAVFCRHLPGDQRRLRLDLPPVR